MTDGAQVNMTGTSMTDRRRACHPDRGMVTFELAVGVLSAAVVAALMCWLISLVGLQTACGDVAAQVARQMARGDSAAADAVIREAPRGAKVTTTEGAGQVQVRVDVDARWGQLGPVHLTGRAVLPKEPQ